jgi:hypothetical protein
MRRVRTIEEFDRDVRQFVDSNGRAPTRGDGKLWLQWADWFRYRDLDYRERVAELGYGHSFANIKEAMREWIAVHGSHPTEDSSPLWRRRRSWLRKRGSSLVIIARELGLDVTERRTDRTIAELEDAIAAYESVHGHSPPCSAAPWYSWRGWLKKRGMLWSAVATTPRSRHRPCAMCSRDREREAIAAESGDVPPQFMLL